MSNLTSPRILIVEGLGNVAKSLSGHLASFRVPLRILTAPDADTALEELQRKSIDLIIIDTFLRGRLTGFDLCRTLKKNDSETENLPVILLLPGFRHLERLIGISAGADFLLHKPVTKDELLRQTEVILNGKIEEMTNSHSDSQNHNATKSRRKKVKRVQTPNSLDPPPHPTSKSKSPGNLPHVELPGGLS